MADFNPENYETNPLKKYFRQPKVYTTLPSKGRFYPQGAIDMPENFELAVFPMTAKDELTMKTPDALLNGQATVSLIQSCVPDIKDAWQMPSIDLDAILIAIRIATYGEIMELTVKVPGIDEERKFDVDLRQILNKLVTVDYISQLEIDRMTVDLRPLTYREFTNASLKTFEEQRIFALVNNDTISDQEKLLKFNESFSKLTNLTVDTMGKCVSRITIGDDAVTNPAHIEEFIQNADKAFYKNVVAHLDSQKEKFQIEPIRVQSPEEDVEKGAPKTWTVPITFDQSNFFA